MDLVSWTALRESYLVRTAKIGFFPFSTLVGKWAASSSNFSIVHGSPSVWWLANVSYNPPPMSGKGKAVENLLEFTPDAPEYRTVTSVFARLLSVVES